MADEHFVMREAGLLRLRARQCQAFLDVGQSVGVNSVTHPNSLGLGICRFPGQRRFPRAGEDGEKGGWAGIRPERPHFPQSRSHQGPSRAAIGGSRTARVDRETPGPLAVSLDQCQKTTNQTVGQPRTEPPFARVAVNAYAKDQRGAQLVRPR